MGRSRVQRMRCRRSLCWWLTPARYLTPPPPPCGCPPQVFKAHITTSPSGQVSDMFWLYDNRNELPENHRCGWQGCAGVWVEQRFRLGVLGQPRRPCKREVAAPALSQPPAQGCTSILMASSETTRAPGALPSPGCWRCATASRARWAAQSAPSRPRRPTRWPRPRGPPPSAGAPARTSPPVSLGARVGAGVQGRQAELEVEHAEWLFNAANLLCVLLQCAPSITLCLLPPPPPCPQPPTCGALWGTRSRQGVAASTRSVSRTRMQSVARVSAGGIASQADRHAVHVPWTCPV